MGMDNIPPELRDLRQWVCYRPEPDPKKPGKLKKPPYRTNGVYAKPNDPATWATFDEARRAVEEGGYGFTGVGFMLTAGDPYAVVDLDHVRNPETGSIHPGAAAVVKALDSYTEVSCSGTGIHVFVRAEKPEGGNKKEGAFGPGTDFEAYDGRGMTPSKSNRYIAMTGDILDGRAEVRDRQAEYTAVYREFFPEAATEGGNPTEKGAPSLWTSTASEVLEVMERSQKWPEIEPLMKGDTTAHGGDDSSADLALCNHLAFFTGKDADLMDELFRGSGLMRPKWDEMHGAQTYGQMTIAKAVQDCRAVYDPAYRSKAPTAAKVGGSYIQGSDELAPWMQDEHKAFPWHMGEKGQGKFLVSNVAEGLITVDHVRFIGGTIAHWSAEKGRYIAGRSNVEALMNRLDPGISSRQRREVLAYLDLRQDPNAPRTLWREPGSSELIAFSNVVLNWKSGEVMGNSPGLNLLATIPHDYDPEAECPELDRALDDWSCGDDDVRQAIIDVAAQSLMTNDPIHRAVLLTNEQGANGKSTFLALLRNMVGRGNHVGMSLDTLGERFGAQAIMGAVLVTGDDLPPSERLANPSEKFKNAVTHDQVQAEIKNGPHFTFSPACNFVYACNGTPTFTDRTHGMRRRWAVVPFNGRFTGRGFDRGAVLGERGCRRIIRLAVEAMPSLVERGNITPTAEGERIFSQMWNVGDPIAEWVSDTWPEGASFDKLSKDELYGEFVTWCETVGMGDVLPRTAFSRRMASTFRLKDTTTVPANHGRSGKKVRCFLHTPETQNRIDEVIGSL